jgi:hypothetical protein
VRVSDIQSIPWMIYNVLHQSRPTLHGLTKFSENWFTLNITARFALCPKSFFLIATPFDCAVASRDFSATRFDVILTGLRFASLFVTTRLPASVKMNFRGSPHRGQKAQVVSFLAAAFVIGDRGPIKQTAHSQANAEQACCWPTASLCVVVGLISSLMFSGL